MKYLIIGSEGFIGSHCVAYFLKQGREVYGLDLYQRPSQKYNYIKISRLSPEFDEVLQDVKFDIVVNCAGSADVPYSMSHPLLDFESNSLDTIRILDGIRKHNLDCKYIHFSSAAVYGNPASLPIKETDLLNPLSAYGYHKLIAEQICAEYHKIYGIQISIVRPFSVYGPGLKKQIFWDVFNRIKNTPGEITLFGTGNETRDYIYVDDLLQAINCIINVSPMQCDVYNLASGNQTKIKDAMAIFFKLVAPSKEYSFNDHVRKGDPLYWQADISKIKHLSFTPKISLTEGLKTMANWLKIIGG